MRTRRMIAFLAMAALCAFAAAGLRAQGRFEVRARERVAAVAGLEIITVHDAALDACYTMFVLQPQGQTLPAPTGRTNLQEAAVERDRRLAALNAEFERGLSGGVPATLGSNPLKYTWEGDKVQSDYEHRVRESEMARLEAQLAAIVSEPRLAVAGPAPCEASKR